MSSFKVLSTPKDPSSACADGLGTIAKALGLPVRDFAARTTHNRPRHHRHDERDAHAARREDGAPHHRRACATRSRCAAASARSSTTTACRTSSRWCRAISRRPVRGTARLEGRGDRAARTSTTCARPLEIFRNGGRRRGRDLLHERVRESGARATPRAGSCARSCPGAFVSVSSEVLPAIRFYNRVSTTVLDAYVGPGASRTTCAASRAPRRGRFRRRAAHHAVERRRRSPRGHARAARRDAPLRSRRSAARRRCVRRAARAAKTASSSTWAARASTPRSCAMAQVELKAEGEIDAAAHRAPHARHRHDRRGRRQHRLDRRGRPAAHGARVGRRRSGPRLLRARRRAPHLHRRERRARLPRSRPTSPAAHLRLDAERARRSIDAHVARPLGLDAERAAVGMYRVINANMAHGVREITVKRGLDPREFPLVVAGGAGALHGCAIAARARTSRRSWCRRSPRSSARRACCSPICSTTSCARCVGRASRRSMPPRFESHRGRDGARGRHSAPARGRARRAHRARGRARSALRSSSTTRSPCPWPASDVSTAATGRRSTAAFHASTTGCTATSCRPRGPSSSSSTCACARIGRIDKPDAAAHRGGRRPTPRQRAQGRRAAPTSPRRTASRSCPSSTATACSPATSSAGPALIERTDTTIFVSAGYDARVDDHGTCVQCRQGGRDEPARSTRSWSRSSGARFAPSPTR